MDIIQVSFIRNNNKKELKFDSDNVRASAIRHWAERTKQIVWKTATFTCTAAMVSMAALANNWYRINIYLKYLMFMIYLMVV